MNPDELRALLEKLGRFLETAGGGYSRRLPDVPQEQRTIGRADPRNVPVSADELAALPRPRTSKADKIIGGVADFTPVASFEQLRQAYHNAKAGKYGSAALAGAMAAMDLVPGEGQAAHAAEKAVAKAAAKGHPEIQAIMREMQQASGGRNLPRITAIDPEKGRLLARAYESLPVNDPNAKRAYDALNREVAAQKKRLEDAGFKFEFVDEDPYKSSKEMMADVAQNRRLKVFKTGDDAAHPYMTKEQNNDFRAVHDLLAHAGEGHQFGPVGEENAYRVHSSTLSREALPALAAETRGQNSWVNFGPNAHLPVRERPFAQQKAALFPEHLTGDYDTMTPDAVDALHDPNWRQNGFVKKLQAPAGDSVATRPILQRLQAAVRFPDGETLTGKTHFDAIQKTDRSMDELQMGYDGFMLDGKFLSRDEATKLLQKEGALPHDFPRPVAAEEINDLRGPADSVAARGAERVVSAALRSPMGDVTFAPSHFEALGRTSFQPWEVEDGFLTDAGRFVSRDEAAALQGHNAAEAGRFGVEDMPGKLPGYKGRASGEISAKDMLTPGDSVAVDWAAKHVLAKDNDAAVSRFKSTANDIRAFPDQRRNDLIDALRGEAYMRPDPYRAPAVITRDRWKPTSRGVFDRTPGSELVREPAPLPFEAKAKPKSTGLHPVAEQIANDPRVVKRILSDVEKGRDLGGIGWYGLEPLRRNLEELGGPFNFRDVNMAGAAGSAQTSTSNELANMSLNLFGRKHGLDTEGAREEFLRRFPNAKRPFYSEDHRKLFDRGMERGIMGPNKPTDGALKIPNYFHNRMLGANGVPIDTHEQRMMSQATGLSMDDIKAAMAAGGNNYEALTQPYHRVAEQLGLTPDQVQASRWIGGALETKLKSQPRGDFLQTLEDGLLYTARSRGLDESPKGLRNLWGNIVKGDDFFMPFYGEGGFPVY